MRKFIFIFSFTFLAFCQMAVAFDEESFCKELKQMSDSLREEGSIWVDNSTRQDGIAVVCSAKTVEYKKFIKVSKASFRDGWQVRKQSQWDEIYCEAGSPFREAIDNGWEIISHLTFIEGETHRIIAKCS